MSNQYGHYFKDVRNLDTVDVYRVLELFNVVSPCLQHAIKKLLVAGGRGSKDMGKDVAEAIVSLQRWQAMRVEDNELPVRGTPWIPDTETEAEFLARTGAPATRDALQP